jgi:hypothetical protein
MPPVFPDYSGIPDLGNSDSSMALTTFMNGVEPVEPMFVGMQRDTECQSLSGRSQV